MNISRRRPSKAGVDEVTGCSFRVWLLSLPTRHLLLAASHRSTEVRHEANRLGTGGGDAGRLCTVRLGCSVGERKRKSQLGGQLQLRLGVHVAQLLVRELLAVQQAG